MIKPSLAKRIFSALIMAPLAALCIYWGDVPFLIMVLVGALVTIHEWYGLAKQLDKIFIPLMLAGTAYLALALCSLLNLRFDFPHGAALTFIIICGVVVSDISAYAVGKMLKGPKLCPNLSPNKTWAGLSGAMIGFALCLGILGRFLEHGQGDISLLMLIGAGLLLGLVAQIGDLLISFLKRRANMKDTGKLIPGHGGLLDRIDALLLVLPVSLALLKLFH